VTYRGHLAGGVVFGVAAGVGTAITGLTPSHDYASAAGVAATAFFFSLFPDLDTSSVPQRWFFRVVFAALVYLGWRGRYELATLMALVALLPVLDQHRGWTHGRWSPLVMPVILGAIYELWRWPQRAAGDAAAPGSLDAAHLAYLAAAVAGWYGHLLLDGKFRVFPRDER